MPAWLAFHGRHSERPGELRDLQRKQDWWGGARGNQPKRNTGLEPLRKRKEMGLGFSWSGVLHRARAVTGTLLSLSLLLSSQDLPRGSKPRGAAWFSLTRRNHN